MSWVPGEKERLAMFDYATMGVPLADIAEAIGATEEDVAYWAKTDAEFGGMIRSQRAKMKAELIRLMRVLSGIDQPEDPEEFERLIPDRRSALLSAQTLLRLYFPELGPKRLKTKKAFTDPEGMTDEEIEKELLELNARWPEDGRST